MSAGPRGRVTSWFVANSEGIVLGFISMVMVVLLALAGLPYYGEALGVSTVAGVPVGSADAETVGVVSGVLALVVLALLGAYLAIR